MQRRDAFSEEAPSLTKADFAFDIIAIPVGIVAFALSIVALVRGQGHRGPYIVLLLAVLCYLINHAFNAAFTVISFDESVDQEFNTTQIGIGAVDYLATAFTDVLMLMTCFSLLYNRAGKAYRVHTQKVPNYATLRKVLDGIDFALLFILILVIVILSRVGETLLDNFDISENAYINFLKASNDVSYVYTFLYLIMIINLAISALLVKLSMSKAGVVDRPTNFVLFAVVPLFIIHGIYFLFTTIYFGVIFNQELSQNGLNIELRINFVSIFEGCVVPAAIMLLLLAAGISRTHWTTFGEAEMQDARAPRVYNTPMAYGQQPMWGQQPYQQPGMYQQLPGFNPYGQPQQPGMFPPQPGAYGQPQQPGLTGSPVLGAHAETSPGTPPLHAQHGQTGTPQIDARSTPANK